MPFERMDLVISNRDLADCWLSTSWQRTPYLDVQLPACMVQAGQSITVPVVFTPRDFIEYRERIEFVINDCVKSYVNVRGRGCQMNLELVSMAMQNVDFGVAVGSQPVTRTVKVVNRSQRALDFCLVDPDGHLSDRCVSWQPTLPVSLRPKEQMSVDLRFAPAHRIAPFKLPLRASCNYGEEVHLLNVAGTCHTAEVKLSEHSILFGDVVYQSTAVRKVRLHNFGDLGVKFRFELPAKMAAQYSIEPAEGFAAPHDDVMLQVKYHPTRPASGAAERGERSEGNRPRRIQVILEPSYQHDPVELVVQGRGVDQPEGAIKVLEFTAEVRERKVLEIPVPGDPLGKNPTNEPWKLNPIIKTENPAGNDYWFAPAEITVPPGQQTKLEITYRPLTMTLRDEDRHAQQEAEEEAKTGTGRKSKRKELPPEKHIGKVFIATPDGNAFVFSLEGTALPPKSAEKISAQVQCKTAHVQGVEISNWLQESQRFNVKITLVEPADAREEIKVQGAETFDLPPGGAKEYKFNVYAYREGKGLARLVFTNPKTDEFLTMEVAFTFVAPDTLQIIEMETACRQTAVRPISVLNPLSTPVTFKCESSHADIRFSPIDLVIPPNSEGSVDVLFRPVLPGPGQASLKLKSAELGDYPYTVKFDAKPAGLEKTIVFKAPLGSTDTVQQFKFLHYASKPAQYTARIEAAPGHKGPAGDFVVETKDIKATAATDTGVEVVVDVRFQPSSLGEIRALLVLTSPDGGDYKALLVGYTQPPQPQGPVLVVKGKPGSIDFNNPFDEAVQFNVQVDNPSFIVGSRSFKLDAKKSQAITVNFQSAEAQGGRLIVTAPKVTNPWIFFLKGTL
jgi:hydrocephalus-inducing protein